MKPGFWGVGVPSELRSAVRRDRCFLALTLARPFEPALLLFRRLRWTLVLLPVRRWGLPPPELGGVSLPGVVLGGLGTGLGFGGSLGVPGGTGTPGSSISSI